LAVQGVYFEDPDSITVSADLHHIYWLIFPGNARLMSVFTDNLFKVKWSSPAAEKIMFFEKPGQLVILQEITSL
jgi:hypothetical protein